MKKVILISGHARNGKDATAKLMKERLENDGNKALVVHFADLLKFTCKTFFGWNGQKDKNGRSLLQIVGTDVVRNSEPDFWVNYIAKILLFFGDEWDYVIIPDTRFPNEVSVMKGLFNTDHVRVIRENFDNSLTPDQQNHPSETALDEANPDYRIMNNAGLPELKTAVDNYIKEVLYEE